MKRFLAMALLMALAPTLGISQTRPTTNTLLLECRSALQLLDTGEARNYAEAWACSSYMAGLRDGISTALEASTICIPQTVTGGQLIRIFVRWADDNPALLHEDQALGALRALRQAFPCATG